MKKLLLIRGLGHSGTTILDLALGAHPRMVGLGEAARILERPSISERDRGPARLRGDLRFERRCTCGEIAIVCELLFNHISERYNCTLCAMLFRCFNWRHFSRLFPF